jgi:5-methyltetrahydropteroyltriglutamate--homocysteine methyltransferase
MNAHPQVHNWRHTLPLLPVQTIGSAAVPGWLWVLREAIADGRVGRADVQEALQDAALVALRDMEDCGFDIVSDGEMFRGDFSRAFHECVEGLAPLEFDRHFGYPGPDQLEAFRCIGQLTVPNGYGMVPEIEWLRNNTTKPFVSALQSPLTQAFRIDGGEFYPTKVAIAWAIAPYINAELKAAVAAGATYVQFDEPTFWLLSPDYDEIVELFNTCVIGVDALIGIHLCFGNFRGRPATSDRRIGALAPHLQELHADVIHIEFANRGMDEHDLWERHGGDKILCAGVIDVKGRTVDPLDAVIGRIRLLLRHVAPEKLWLAADCGFSQTARSLAVGKMSSVVAAAAQIRSEL